MTLADCYSDLMGDAAKQDLLKQKQKRLEQLLASPELKNSQKIIVTRCPGRISFTKHADYVNNDLIYTTDDRDVFCALGFSEEGAGLKLINQDEGFVDKDYSGQDWARVLKESEAQKDWDFYVIKLIEKLKLEKFINNLCFVLNSDLPAAGGLSSSHALMLSSYLALTEVLELKPVEPLKLLKLCQEIEHERGFKSGLGDQAAQLLCKKDHLLFVKLLPDLKCTYFPRPKDMGLMTVPSMIKVDKSLPECQEVNENIQRYKSINDSVAKIFNTKNEIYGLGDLLYEFSDPEILEKLKSVEDEQLRLLALYALAEAARAHDLKENGFDLVKLGHYLNLSHKAEALDKSDVHKEIDLNKSLAEHIGYYGASTRVNDELQAKANDYKNVLGSSISGAGLGGNNIVLYHGNAPELGASSHVSYSSKPLSRIM